MTRPDLALEPDFRLGFLQVHPSACRVVHGESELRLEALTMSVLVVLAQAAGSTVTKEELINTCWQGRFVSDEAVARTVSKVRLLARGMNPVPFVLEVVPKVGYRLVPNGEAEAANEPLELPPEPVSRRWLPVALVAGSIMAAFLLGIAVSGWQLASASAQRPESAHIYADDIVDAIFTMDEERLGMFLRSGWKVNWSLDPEGSTALTTLPLVCERDEKHDHKRLLKIAKLLVAAGAVTTHKNRWGDSAYNIAVSPRYCGRDHVVTEYLRSATLGATTDPGTMQAGSRTP
jgi:DNA-binding winged helix-turn-helix (wHTH) protein